MPNRTPTQYPAIVIHMPNLTTHNPNGLKFKVSVREEVESLVSYVSKVINDTLPRGADGIEPTSKGNFHEYQGVSLAAVDTIIKKLESQARPISQLIQKDREELARQPEINLGNIQRSPQDTRQQPTVALALMHSEGYNSVLEMLSKACTLKKTSFPLEIRNHSAGYSIVIVSEAALNKAREQQHAKKILDRFQLKPEIRTQTVVPSLTEAPRAPEPTVKPVTIAHTSNGNYIISVAANAQDNIVKFVNDIINLCDGSPKVLEPRDSKYRVGVPKAVGEKIIQTYAALINVKPSSTLSAEQRHTDSRVRRVTDERTRGDDITGSG